MRELAIHEVNNVDGGILPALVAAGYAARGAVALYGIFEAARYAANEIY
ncbi:hypothetical protein [Thalassomonas actiniarum]|uniref:Uncharacterized protein n=1 Tax=Thalassomonas actiniarum TaxID=485447 RepID=A0AAE9YQ73_9GAMM|nr:hypothetical protein [Thalassomonas actiniarum]WDD99185.1 hypothetical protein SG35_000400 [Thalassomonas actiniarum]